MIRKIFISTGEVSGDLHGSLLAKALLEEAKKRSIEIKVFGLGGQRSYNSFSSCFALN